MLPHFVEDYKAQTFDVESHEFSNNFQIPWRQTFYHCLSLTFSTSFLLHFSKCFEVQELWNTFSFSSQKVAKCFPWAIVGEG